MNKIIVLLLLCTTLCAETQTVDVNVREGQHIELNIPYIDDTGDNTDLIIIPIDVAGNTVTWVKKRLVSCVLVDGVPERSTCEWNISCDVLIGNTGTHQFQLYLEDDSGEANNRSDSIFINVIVQAKNMKPFVSAKIETIVTDLKKESSDGQN